MIRKILFLLVLFSGFFACKEDEELRFDVPVEFRRDLRFRPTPGGAVMKYYLPDNSDIFGVRVRYTNAWGELLTKDGTYLSDSVVLGGFTEARENVPAKVSFFNCNMVESESIDMTFDTENSATIAVFDSLTVNPFWGGFNVTYRSPETVSGMIHVFYIGINPMTQQLDSILMSSVPIVEGGDTLNFVLQQPMGSVDVIVRTDDYKGFRVKQQITTVPCLSMVTLEPSDFDFKFTGKIVEDATHQLGEKYLFDGDGKGVEYRKNRLAGERYKYSTFVAGPYAFGERFIVGLREKKVPAAVRLHAFLYYETDWPYRLASYPLVSEVWSGYYMSRLPCKIALYGTNENPENVDLGSCARLYSLNYSPSYGNFLDSWAAYTDYSSNLTWKNSYLNKSESELEAAEPVVLDMQCNYTGEQYQYLIFVVEDTFDSARWNGQEENALEYVTFNELEVCVKAE